MIDFEKYCVRCDSEAGWQADRPDWCAVCWDTRLSLPRRLRELIDSLQKRT